MSIYVIAHKRFKTSFNFNDRKTLLVGAEGKDNLTGFDYYDNTKINISNKNKNYCELTGLYWLWKNSSDKYVGIEHYRRYFTHDFFGRKLLNDSEIRELLRIYDIILPFPKRFPTSIENDYINNSGYKRDLDELTKIIKKRYPEYISEYKKVMEGNTLYLFNMMILNKHTFDNYCAWLFDILFELEKKVSLEGYSDYQKRIYGFLSERLLNVWILHNNLKCCPIGVINIEQKQNITQKILTGLKRKILFKKYGTRRD
ncbi:DUF4422 domain-containing protein [Limosilactobacillus reuteri]|uniref:DUF4422 domain-containing protein n=1 Tax=Limosilactobacillus reuteri TaxID=1598 RepID=UPI001E6184C9|nr:DUF4422 domain-containing protein [Limosilactobacillus reuteri]MCC4381911.1 DUF4422 domain-containing protein [Limosilactobacillus reuteri]